MIEGDEYRAPMEANEAYIRRERIKKDYLIEKKMYEKRM